MPIRRGQSTASSFPWNHLCSCCALKILMKNPTTFMSELEDMSHYFIDGSEKAVRAEDEIIKKCFSFYKMNPNEIHDSEKLRRCWQHYCVDPGSLTSVLSISDQQIRRQLSLVMLKLDSTLLDPAHFIHFKMNGIIELHLSICILCKQHIPYTDTVNLQCACTCCQKCTLMYVLSKKEGFNDVFDCPNCSVITNNIIQNLEHMQACVNSYIQSAVHYWSHICAADCSEELKRDWVNMILMYQKFGYVGYPCNLNDAPKETLRIVLALCEEIRLNYLHYNIHNTVVLQINWVPVSRKWLDTILETDQNNPKLSFLGTVSVPKYTAFDTDMKLLKEQQKAAESIALNKINTIINNNNIKSKLTAIDKIIIYSLLQNKNPQNNSISILYKNTITDIYLIIQQYLNKFQLPLLENYTFIKNILPFQLDKLKNMKLTIPNNVSMIFYLLYILFLIILPYYYYVINYTFIIII